VSRAHHIPVMGAEVAAALAPRDGQVFVDGTFGAGGYSKALLNAADCRVIGVDRDPSVAEYVEGLQSIVGDRLTFTPGCFSELGALIKEPVDGVVLDLGVSSMQLDQGSRGFSFKQDGPLDMRMGDAGMTAAELIATIEEAELADILYRFGEEKASRKIAKAIVEARKEQAITTTLQLQKIVASVVKGGPKDPATRTFQALRMAVNGELEELQQGLEAAERILKPGGRLVVVTFHSLEDRMVKRFLDARCGVMAGVSRHVPVGAEVKAKPTFQYGDWRKRKVTDAEAARNPRARSAMLRSAIRTEAP
jgi:16S rRNA (cytosine1402-N4)-methyltransferase